MSRKTTASASSAVTAASPVLWWLSVLALLVSLVRASPTLSAPSSWPHAVTTWSASLSPPAYYMALFALGMAAYIPVYPIVYTLVRNATRPVPEKKEKTVYKDGQVADDAAATTTGRAPQQRERLPVPVRLDVAACAASTIHAAITAALGIYYGFGIGSDAGWTAAAIWPTTERRHLLNVPGLVDIIMAVSVPYFTCDMLYLWYMRVRHPSHPIAGGVALIAAHHIVGLSCLLLWMAQPLYATHPTTVDSSTELAAAVSQLRAGNVDGRHSHEYGLAHRAEFFVVFSMVTELTTPVMNARSLMVTLGRTGAADALGYLMILLWFPVRVFTCVFAVYVVVVDWTWLTTHVHWLVVSDCAFFTVLLCALNCWWAYLLCRKVRRVLCGGGKKRVKRD